MTWYLLPAQTAFVMPKMGGKDDQLFRAAKQSFDGVQI